MTKATTSAIDFLAAISGGTELFEVSGVTVELRSLTFAEAQQLNNKHKDDNLELTFQALAFGLVSPVLTDAEREQMRQSRPGPISAMAKRVMQISGMLGDEEAPGSPLAGGGSSPDPTTEQPT